MSDAGGGEEPGAEDTEFDASSRGASGTPRPEQGGNMQLQPRPKVERSPPPVFPNLPKWKQKLLQNGSVAAGAKAAALVRESHKREAEARERLNQLKARAQRALTRAASEAAMLERVERKRQTVVLMREESKRNVGKDITERLAMLHTPTEDEVRELSVLFNAQLAKHYRCMPPPLPPCLAGPA
jgi:hypothetical protein